MIMLSRNSFTPLKDLHAKMFGSGVLNQGAVILCFVTESFLTFLAPAGNPSPAGQSLTLN